MLAAPPDLMAIAACTIDLCAEFEVQLRAVVRLQEQLRKALNGEDLDGSNLDAAVQRAVEEMLTSNASIGDILKHIESASERRAATA
jgi:hypothetical protein